MHQLPFIYLYFFFQGRNVLGMNSKAKWKHYWFLDAFIYLSSCIILHNAITKSWETVPDAMSHAVSVSLHVWFSVVIFMLIKPVVYFLWFHTYSIYTIKTVTRQKRSIGWSNGSVQKIMGRSGDHLGIIFLTTKQKNKLGTL